MIFVYQCVIWYDIIWYDMILYDRPIYNMIWYDMIWIVFHLFTSKDICCFLSFVFHALVSPSIMIFFFIISFSVNRHEMRYPNLMLIILKFSFDFLCVPLTSTFSNSLSPISITCCHTCVHIYSYMLLELLKNSMRATVELHGMDNMPPIRIIIADGEDNEDVSV